MSLKKQNLNFAIAKRIREAKNDDELQAIISELQDADEENVNKKFQSAVRNKFYDKVLRLVQKGRN